MEELIEILEEINPEADYRTCDTLVDDGILTSFELVLLVTQISQEFGVSIPPAWIVPEHFNSAAAMYEMIRQLEGED